MSDDDARPYPSLALIGAGLAVIVGLVTLIVAVVVGIFMAQNIDACTGVVVSLIYGLVPALTIYGAVRIVLGRSQGLIVTSFGVILIGLVVWGILTSLLIKHREPWHIIAIPGGMLVVALASVSLLLASHGDYWRWRQSRGRRSWLSSTPALPHNAVN